MSFIKIPSNDHSIPMGKKKTCETKTPPNPTETSTGRSLEEKALLRPISPRFPAAEKKKLGGSEKAPKPRVYWGTKKVNWSNL